MRREPGPGIGRGPEAKDVRGSEDRETAGGRRAPPQGGLDQLSRLGQRKSRPLLWSPRPSRAAPETPPLKSRPRPSILSTLVFWVPRPLEAPPLEAPPHP